MKIGTRGSALALWQARAVAERLHATGAPPCEIVVIRTSGDEAPGPALLPMDVSNSFVIEDAPANVKRMFVKEIEEALLDGRIDLAVHSSKDLPALLPDGLTIAAALPREDPHDALVLPAARTGTLMEGDFALVRDALAGGVRIATSSVRRIAELQPVFPNAIFVPIRGNVDTRLRKLDAGECDALVLAAAGIKRLGLSARLSALVPLDLCIPAPGQGIVAIEIAEATTPAVRAAVARVNDADAGTALLAERAVVRTLGGGCQMPLGVLAVLEGQQLIVRALVASLDGQTILRDEVAGGRDNAAALGEQLGAQLLSRGAEALLHRG